MLTLKAWLFFGRRKAVSESSVTALSGLLQGGGRRRKEGGEERGGELRRVCSSNHHSGDSI